LLYAAEAIGYQGQGAPEGPFAPAGVNRFVRRDLHPADFERATKWIAEKAGYRPVWVQTVDGAVRDLQVTPLGRHLAVNTVSGVIRWDFTVPEKPIVQKSPHALKLDGELQPVPGAVFDLDAAGETVAIADPKGIQVGKQVLPTTSPALQLRFDPRDANFAAIHEDGTCRLFFHHALGAPHQAWASHKPEAPVRAVAYDPVRDRIALGDAEGMVSVWNVADAQKVAAIATPERHEKPVVSLDFRSDGRRLISGSEDGTLRLWNSERDVPVLLATLTGHEGPVTAVRYLPGGQLVASGGADGTVRLWAVEEDLGRSVAWHDYVQKEWYSLGKGQAILWKQGTGFLNLPEKSLVAQWRSGTEPLRPDAWGEAGLLAAFEAAQKAGRYHEARLRARQMNGLGLKAPQVAFQVTPGEAFENGEGAKMLWCKPGTFTMGDTEQSFAKPHQVTLTEGYWLARTEVTQAVYQAVIGTNPSTNTATGPQGPVENLSWFEAEIFCQRLTDWERARGTIPPGWEYRLPTEAQWEYACRAGTTTAYSFGDEVGKLHRFGNYNDKSGGGVGYANSETEHDDGHGYTAPVGSFGENPWGFVDMHGNVFEWCRDSLDVEAAAYPEGPQRDPIGITGAHRVDRGGGFSITSAYCRSGFRSASRPSIRVSILGFRPALVPGSGTRPAK
jgi:formylglycine-generating enzyme required for sulfatase activity